MDRYDDDTGEIWLLFHNGMSALEFFQEFLKLKEDTIDIYLRDEVSIPRYACFE